MTGPPIKLVTFSVALPLAVLVLSLALAVYARRGRRVDDRLLCRRCGFDLFGKPAASTVCSECGADLTSPRAIRTGNRVARRRLFAVVLPLLLASAAWLAVTGFVRAKGVDWNRHKPAAWLVRDAERGGSGVRDAALAELTRRIRDGTLPQDREEAIVRAALAYHADPRTPWVVGWGNVVYAAHLAGRVADDRWREFLYQAAKGSHPQVRETAFDELTLRLGDGTIPQPELDELVDEALSRQADPQRPWVASWGGLIENVQIVGRLSDDRRDRYLVQGYAFSMRPTRSTFRPHDAIEFRVWPAAGRWGPLGVPCVTGAIGLYAPQEVRIGRELCPAEIEHPWAWVSGAYKADWLDMPECPDGERVCFANNSDAAWLADVRIPAGVHRRPLATAVTSQSVRVRLILRPTHAVRAPATTSAPAGVSRVVELDSTITYVPPEAEPGGTDR